MEKINVEIGMWVRFKDKRNVQYIRKIVKIPEDNRYASIYLDKEANYSNGLSFKNVIKVSFNKIDLIEVGDYVNGYRVQLMKNGSFQLEGLNSGMWLNNENYGNRIKSILTKEQFEEREYVFEDNL